MGLITILSSLFQIGVIVHGEFDDQRIKNESKARAIESGHHTYMDSHGREYDVKTGRQMYMTVDNGDKILRDIKTNKPVYNLDLEKREKSRNANKEKAILEGKRFYFDSVKKLYCEIKTGKYYKRGNGFLDGYGDPYWDVEDEKRYVYEYNEGPSDDELRERKNLYLRYLDAEKKYKSFGFIDMLDYKDKMDEYHKKVIEKSAAFSRMSLIECEIYKYDAQIKKKYCKYCK